MRETRRQERRGTENSMINNMSLATACCFEEAGWRIYLVTRPLRGNQRSCEKWTNDSEIQTKLIVDLQTVKDEYQGDFNNMSPVYALHCYACYVTIF